MSDTKVPAGTRPQVEPDGLPNGVPLFILSAAFIAGAYLSWAGFLVRNVGRIPLWSLLFLLGVLAAVGGVIAFLFAEEGQPFPGEVETIVTTPSRPVGGDRAEVDRGRPRPEVRAEPAIRDPWRETWPEDGLPSPQATTARVQPVAPSNQGKPKTTDRSRPPSPGPSANATPARRRPTPVELDQITTDIDSMEFESISAELDRIEREISSRRTRKDFAAR